MRVREIIFKAGQNKGTPSLHITTPTVTLIVGPNNSGKSLALKEIEDFCQVKKNSLYSYTIPGIYHQDNPKKVIHKVDIEFPHTYQELRNLLLAVKIDPPEDSNEQMMEGDFWVGVHSFEKKEMGSLRESTDRKPALIIGSELKLAMNNKDKLMRILGPLYCVYLDGKTRFSLIEPMLSGDLSAAPQNHLWALFTDESKRIRVSELTREAFGLNFLVDPTGMVNFKIRLSVASPEKDEEGLGAKAIKFYNAQPLISEFGDGVKAFTGLVAALLSLRHTIILIDEPEAFLHPPLSRRLGDNLAKIAQERGASLIVATHSAEFTFGCLDSGIDVSVVRLTYERGIPAARSLESDEVRTIMNDALMRSTHVLQALFARATIVTEGDSDRAFYEEINRRLQVERRGIKDGFFLNAQNVHTLYKIVGPLRKIGISAAAIADLDFILDGDNAWENILEACNVPKREWQRIQSERKNIATKGDNIKENGLSRLSEKKKGNAEKLLKELGDYGLFIVPVGELECWLKEKGAAGHGPDWLADLFSKIGNSEADTNYLKPVDEDVWVFLDEIAEWIEKEIVR